MNEDEGGGKVTIPAQYPGKFVRRDFEFCKKYKKDPFKDINHRLDNYKGLNNFYNLILDDFTSSDVICFLRLADYLNLPQLLQLICYKVTYLMRQLDAPKRLDFFGVKDQWLDGYADDM